LQVVMYERFFPSKSCVVVFVAAVMAMGRLVHYHETF